MRPATDWLWPLSLMTIAACGPEFAAATTDLDAAVGVNEAGTDHNELSDATAPPVADGLLLWLRADLGVTTSEGGVSIWADQSGNHLDARQTDSTRRPTLGPIGTMVRAPLVFDGEDFLSLPSGFADFSRGVSLFVVTMAGADSVACADFVHLSNGPEIDDIALGRHDARGNYEVLEGVLTGSDFAAGRPWVVSVVHDVDRDASMRFDGGQKTSATIDLPRLITRMSNVIGRSLYVDCGSVHGALNEILVYQRALDDIERTRVETELQTRWSCCR